MGWVVDVLQDKTEMIPVSINDNIMIFILFSYAIYEMAVGPDCKIYDKWIHLNVR
jgi:hypothetical protein